MRVQLLSDLHLEFEEYHYHDSGSDVLVLAGDIHVKEKGIKWALQHIRNKPVIYVLGNHEFYGKAYPKHIGTLRELCQNSNVHLLENEFVSIDGVNFLGATLWTDFELYGDPRLHGASCQSEMTDYKKIKISPQYRKLRSIDVSAIHRRSLTWLESTLESLEGQSNVVVTHHGPSELSVPEMYKGQTITSAYVSNLETTILKYQPVAWCHGHLHNSSNYRLGNCSVYCNPKGYPDELNSQFDSEFEFIV